MPNTAQGLPYPAPTDPVAGTADAIRRLAQGTETYVQSGTLLVSISATGTPASSRVTFPTPFAAAPTVVVALRGAAQPQNFSAPAATGETATVFDAYVTRIAGAAGSVGVAWVAIGRIIPPA